mmetsp:Transcript_41367/g.81118  ORF Transcript_41367/g.81118 Transcript_41367/m.81118 type:complete len:91 (-) Transcript_41367:602-874(-)
MPRRARSTKAASRKQQKANKQAVTFTSHTTIHSKKNNQFVQAPEIRKLRDGLRQPSQKVPAQVQKGQVGKAEVEEQLIRQTSEQVVTEQY